jgi:Domain of unknown function (DUF4345)
MTERAMQIVLGITGFYLVASGVLAMVAPDTFFDDIGRYGVENSHYVGDVGAFVTASGIGVWLAIKRPSWRAPLLWVGAIWFGLHALNHLFDIGEARSDARGWFDTVVLALGGAGSAFLARDAERLRREAPVPGPAAVQDGELTAPQ